MPIDTVVRARVDRETKKKADAVFKRRGVSASYAIRAFLSSVADTGTLPPSLHIPNEETAKAIRDARAGIGMTRVSSVEELFASLNDEDEEDSEDEEGRA